MRIDLLGPLQVGELGLALEPRDRLALTVLAVRRNQVVTSEQLAEALWPDDPPPSWAKQVQICISRLRKALGAETIVTVHGGYRLVVDESEVDTGRFEQLITRGHAFSAQGEHDRAAVSYARALALWRGDPLTEVDGWSEGQVEAARLQELRRTAQEDWLDERLTAGDHRQVAIDALPFVAQEPLRERRWCTLALAQYRSGRQAEALRTLTRARETLQEELGVDPGPDLVELEDAILGQDEKLAPTAFHAAIGTTCPYKGLAAYTQGDHEEFFGRDGEVTLIRERLDSSPLVVLAGPSGSGKSSLARAGIAAALEQRGRSVAVFVPGRSPLSAMTAAIASAPAHSLLIIDQFEEVFALEVPSDELKAFFTKVALYATETAPVILVIRSDYLGGLAVSAELSRLAEQGLQLVTPLGGEHLRQAVEEPAARAGLRLEAGLVDLLERDTEDEPGALPLLSHALAETWKRRDGNVLTVEAYRASGGIRGAVALSADRLYDSLPEDQRSVLRSLMLRMVSPSLDGPPVRRRMPMRNVASDPDGDRVLALLIRSRLVTAEEDSYELAHEALARAWPRLSSWLDDDAEGQRMMRHLAARAEDWEALGRPDSELYRGARLEMMLEWQGNGRYSLNASEHAFLAASVENASSERTEASLRMRREARQNRRLRFLVVAAGISLIAALVGGSFAVQRGKDARLEALSGQSLALRSTNRAVAALLAVEAYERGGDVGAWSALLSTFTAAPEFLGYQFLPGAESVTGSLVPGTTTAVVAVNGEDLMLFDIATGELEHRFSGTAAEAGGASRLSVSSDGRSVAQFSAFETDLDCFSPESLIRRDVQGCAVLQVFDIPTGEPTMAPVVPPTGLGELAINGDGSLVAVTGGFDGDLAVYRTVDGGLVGRLEGLPRPEGINVWRDAGVAFGQDGLIYLGSMAGTVRVIDPETVEVVAEHEAPQLSSNNFVAPTAEAIYVSGTHALAALNPSGGPPLWVVDLREGKHSEPCPWFAVNPAQREIYCGDFFGVIEVRSLDTGARTGKIIDPQLDSVGDLETTTDGTDLVVFGAGAPAISRWRFDGSGLVTDLIAEGHAIYDGYNAAGDSLLVAERDLRHAEWFEFSDFAVWEPSKDAATSVLPAPLEGSGWYGRDLIAAYSAHENRIVNYDSKTGLPIEDLSVFEIPVTSANWWTSAGGEFLYVNFETGAVWTVDTSTYGRIEPTVRVAGYPVHSSATRDGEWLVISSWRDGSSFIDVFDGESGEHLAGPLEGPMWSAVSLDGTVVGAVGGEIIQYDLRTLEPLGTFAGARGGVNTLRFSDDGRVLLAGGNDQTVSVYDVPTRRRIGDAIETFSPDIGPGVLRPDGKALAVNQKAGVVIWNIDPEDLAEAACRLAGRNLTKVEWDTYMGRFGPYRATCPQFD